MTGLLDTHHLRHCRAHLAEARVVCQATKDIFERHRAQAEYRAVLAMNGSAGKNEEERKRNLTIALGSDSEYQAALSTLRAAEAEGIRAEAELEAVLDQRRAEEWQVRLALVNALDRASIPAEAPGDDVSFDDAGDARVMNTVYDRARVQQEVDELFA